MTRGVRSVITASLLAAGAAGCATDPFDAPPGEHAGQGSIRVTPSVVEASAMVTLTIAYRPGAAGLRPGGGFRIEAPVDPVHPYLGFTRPQTTDRHAPGHVTCWTSRGGTLAGDATARVFGTAASCELTGEALGPEDELVMYRRGLVPRAAGSWPLKALSRHAGSGGGSPLEELPVLEVAPRDASVLHVVAPSLVAAGEPFSLFVTALDDFGNRVRRFDRSIEVELGQARLRHPFDPMDQGAAVLAGIAIERPGFHRARVTLLGPAGEAWTTWWSNPVRVVVERAATVLWGDPHFHEGPGDGPDVSWSFARDAMRLDFAAGVLKAGEAADETARAAFLEAARRADDPGRFVALAGHETKDRLFLTAAPGRPDGREGLAVAIGEAASRGDGAITEIYSWRNRGSGYDDRPRRHEPAPRWLRDDAGGPVAFLAGSGGYWGRPGLDDRTGLEPSAGGLTAVELAGDPAGGGAADRSGEAILRALREGRCWATTGPRIYLSVVRRDGGIEVAAAGTAQLTRLDLVIVRRDSVSEMPLLASPAWEVETRADLPGGGDRSFCYVRAVQQDGEIAWSSPLWPSEREGS